MSALDFGYNASSFAEPYGAAKSSGRNKTTTLFFQSCTALCAGQMAGGVLIVVLSYIYLFEYVMVMGMVVGGVLLGAGAIGIVGNLRKNRDFLNFHIVAAILGIVLCSEFVGQVWREVGVDCAFAELFLKTNALDQVTSDLAHHDMFETVHDRLNDLEDMVGLVEVGMSETINYLHEKPKGDVTRDERDYIKSKLQIIRHHAETVIQQIKSDPATSKEEVAKWKPEDKARIQQKLETAEHIVERIERHDEDNIEHAFTPMEYERMLGALVRMMQTHGATGEIEGLQHKDLAHLSDELEDTKGVLNKISSGLDVLRTLREDTEYQSEESRKHREEMTDKYIHMLEEAKKQHHSDHTLHALEQMPEHCMTERHGIDYIGFIGLITGCLQLCTIYISLCISFRIPIKME